MPLAVRPVPVGRVSPERRSIFQAFQVRKALRRLGSCRLRHRPIASATGSTVATLPPTNSPKDEYDLAYGYFQHKDYQQAAQTFGAFLHRYPSDRLAPEAQYWLGESLFQNQQYHDAAEAFLNVSTKYETTARAPDALLRLGQSLAALGEKEAACASLGEVLHKYPRASLSVKQNVEREQKRAHC